MSRIAQNPKCSLPWCQGKHYAQGYCKPHYRRWLRSGSPLTKNGELDDLIQMNRTLIFDLAQRIHRVERHKGSYETCQICKELKGKGNAS